MFLVNLHDNAEYGSQGRREGWEGSKLATLMGVKIILVISPRADNDSAKMFFFCTVTSSIVLINAEVRSLKFVYVFHLGNSEQEGTSARTIFFYSKKYFFRYDAHIFKNKQKGICIFSCYIL